MKIAGGTYAGQIGTNESNVYQRTVDYPDYWANGYHVMLDTEELVRVRWEQGLDIRKIRAATTSERDSGTVEWVRRLP